MTAADLWPQTVPMIVKKEGRTYSAHLRERVRRGDHVFAVEHAPEGQLFHVIAAEAFDARVRELKRILETADPVATLVSLCAGHAPSREAFQDTRLYKVAVARGWLVWMGDPALDMPLWYRLIRAWALSRGALWAWIEQRAQIIDGLPLYHWPTGPAWINPDAPGSFADKLDSADFAAAALT